MLLRARIWRTMFFPLVVLFATVLEVHSICDLTKGCYPPIFEILDNFTTFPARSVYASSTCGSNSSTPVQYQSLINSDATIYTCDPITIQPINVVDENPTYWQSDEMIKTDGGTTDPQFIVFNFTDKFLIHTVIVSFKAIHNGTSSADARPAAFSIEKLDSTVQNWTTLENFARNCSTSFPGIPVYNPSTADITKTYCVEYTSPVNETFNDYYNEVEYSPGMRYDNFDDNYKNNLTVAALYTAHAIRIFIQEPISTIPLKSYVAISNVLIEAQCICNGHADRCGGQNDATCNCQHNTGGQQCDSCLSLYNNRSWNMGTTTDPGLCLECTCNNRSNTCIFDQVKGYSVCNNCTGSSTGDTCDSCVSGFFINSIFANGSNTTNINTSLSNPNDGTNVGIAIMAGEAFCLACNCNENGTQMTSLLACDVNTGQCLCKERVTQRDCSSCTDMFWGPSVNNILGCNECQCNPNGTLMDNGTAVTECDVTTGQCTCALPGIVGRTCDQCSPVSKNPYEHVSLFYFGSYPNCELCGECFDSWAFRIEEIGQNLAEMNKTVVEIWSSYDFQTAAQVSSNLTDIEDKITKMNESIRNFEGVAIQLKQLQTQYSEAMTRQDRISNEVDILAQTEQTLSIALNSLAILTDVVHVTDTTVTALSALRQQFDDLSIQAVANMSQGNASWIYIQSVMFVVFTPEDRERQLREQVATLMKVVDSANQTLLLTETLYEASLTPGVNKNTQELASILERATNASVVVADMRSVINSVETDIISSNSSLTSLLENATLIRANLLNTVLSLQAYVTNASRSQKAAEKLLVDVKTFKTVAEKAEQTIINSTVTLLEYIATLIEAQNDLTIAMSISNASLAVEVSNQTSMQQLVDQIKNSSMSDAEIAGIKMISQEAKFVADQIVMNAQRALSLSTELYNDVALMNTDIITAQDMRAEAQALHLTCDNMNTSIHDILLQAKNHSDNVSADVNVITQSAQEMEAEIRNVTSCLAQKQLDVSNSMTAANQLKEKADSASSSQLKLIQIMLQINSNSLADVSQTLSSVTHADMLIKQVSIDLEQIEAMAQIESLIQDLQTQNLDINYLDQEITQLTSQLDGLTSAPETSHQSVM